MVSARQILVLVLAAAFVPVVASAQSLGEIAAKERQRREAQKKPPAKVMTETDLANAKGDSASVEVGSAASSVPAPEGGEAKSDAAADPAKKAEAEDKDKLQTAWRAKLKLAEDRLKAEKDAQEVFQRDLNDPNLGVYSQSRQSLQTMLEESRKKAAGFQTEIDGLLAEGRSKGYSR